MSNFLIRIGFLLVVVSLIIIGVVMYPALIAEIKYYFHDQDEITEIVTRDQPDSKEVIVAADKSFSVIVPKIGANSKVIANVDPYNSAEYQQKLTQGVAHAKGTSRPGQMGNTFLFAHSSDNFYNANRYNSVFYLLRKLELEDEFYMVYDEEIYKYTVTDSRIVESDAVEYLYGDPSKETVTLMTCWPPGTTMKRLLVVGELEETN